MSKFVSYKPGTVLDGEGVETNVTIFENDLGELSAVAVGSPIEKILMEEVDGVNPVTEVTEPIVVEPTIEPEQPVSGFVGSIGAQV